MTAKRSMSIFLIFAILFSGLVFRIFYLQVFKGAALSKAASSQRLIDSIIENPRGEIIDRNGIPFTNREKKFSVILKPIYFRNNEEDLKKVCDILELNFNDIRREIDFKKEVIIFETDEKTKKSIAELDVQGISFINSLKRYHENSAAKHILGYLNKTDNVGEAGIEKFYNDVLVYDKSDSIGVITDAVNNPVEGLGYRIIKQEGNNKKLNIKLTLDYHIQKIAENIMDKRNVSGAVVIEDVCNGNIIAMVSKPDFNQNTVEQYLNSPGEELFNRAVASYNIGSIFKIIDSALILEHMYHKQEYFCSGFVKVGDKIFKCSSYDKGGHGLLDLTKAFSVSCNSYFIDNGIKMGYSNIIEMAKRFGMGTATGIWQQGIDESTGNLPDSDRHFSMGDIANISIGQGEIMATPLQVVDIVATIANGGIKNRVNIVDCIIDDNENKVRDVRKKQGERIVSKETAERIKDLMEAATITGTGIRANLDEYGGAGGKTGSAETGRRGVAHAWFAGYFPKNNPKYAIAVFVENGGSGGQVAAPIFAEIAEIVIKKGL